MKKSAKALLILLGILVALYLASKALFPFLEMPKPTGQNTVKTEVVYFQHETSYPHMATSGKLREIPVQVYYPEALEEGAHPLFIFSHGSFGIASSNETLFYELASHGYIVMSLSHPYHSFFTRLSSGKTVLVDKTFFAEVVSSPGSKNPSKTLRDLNRWLDPRIEDMNLILDTLMDEKLDNAFEEYINTEKITLSGHSLGGSAALAIGRQRPEDISSLVILEAPFVKDIVSIEADSYVFTEKDYPRSVLHIYSDALWNKMETITTYGQNVKMIQAMDSRYPIYHLEGVGHLGLTDLSLSTPLLTKLLDGGLQKKEPIDALTELNEVVLTFLE
ncbi:MAG: hypothetical protein Q4E22_07060 [Coriobacteriia bacterium]|nr:hypothetical protein [Coriobacteriia bacterium]